MCFKSRGEKRKREHKENYFLDISKPDPDVHTKKKTKENPEQNAIPPKPPDLLKPPEKRKPGRPKGATSLSKIGNKPTNKIYEYFAKK